MGAIPGNGQQIVQLSALPSVPFGSFKSQEYRAFPVVSLTTSLGIVIGALPEFEFELVGGRTIPGDAKILVVVCDIISQLQWVLSISTLECNC
jgi:hypothetical protein